MVPSKNNALLGVVIAALFFAFLWILAWWNPTPAILNEDGERSTSMVTSVTIWNWLLTVAFLLAVSIVASILNGVSKPKKQELELVGVDEAPSTCAQQSEPRQTSQALPVAQPSSSPAAAERPAQPSSSPAAAVELQAPPRRGRRPAAPVSSGEQA